MRQVFSTVEFFAVLHFAPSPRLVAWWSASVAGLGFLEVQGLPFKSNLHRASRNDSCTTLTGTTSAALVMSMLIFHRVLVFGVCHRVKFKLGVRPPIDDKDDDDYDKRVDKQVPEAPVTCESLAIRRVQARRSQKHALLIIAELNQRAITDVFQRPERANFVELAFFHLSQPRP
ncbi:hypothetical protein ZHAS_00010645 [Anopheles sinensis]|uniref:Uncharacterized protein n=1 Tax=Anopheles sinensis TaxID=74873 RepID=A0A084VY45_ANOSI|nr:hypothetical protein ZHAS_00010645 [Anopheles sinensis]